MGELFFTSTLDQTYRGALEQLFYHNNYQDKMIEAVLLAIKRYGTPSISMIKDRLWVTFESKIEAQSLFVLEKAEPRAELVGVVVYTRKDNELVVLFAAVREDYAHGGIRSDRRLLLRMVDEVRSIARRVKGITSISVFAGGKAPMRMSLRTAKKRP